MLSREGFLHISYTVFPLTFLHSAVWIRYVCSPRWGEEEELLLSLLLEPSAQYFPGKIELVDFSFLDTCKVPWCFVTQMTVK